MTPLAVAVVVAILLLLPGEQPSPCLLLLDRVTERLPDGSGAVRLSGERDRLGALEGRRARTRERVCVSRRGSQKKWVLYRLYS